MPVSDTPSKMLIAVPSTSTQLDTPSKNISDSVWTSGFQVEWSRVPKPIMKVLEASKWLSGLHKSKLVRVVMDQVLALCQTPKKADLKLVAELIVKKYPQSFQDQIGGDVVGNGIESLLLKLIHRRDNLTRSPDILSFKRRMAPIKTPLKKRPCDSYGCVNWQPGVPEDLTDINACSLEMKEAMTQPASQWNLSRLQKAMEITFPSQRQQINGGASVADLQEEWPFLFQKEGIGMHYHLLMGTSCHEILLQSLSEKGAKLLTFISNKEAPRDKEIKALADAVVEDEDKRVILPAVVLTVMHYFKEPVDNLFILHEVSSCGLGTELTVIIIFFVGYLL